ncbi:polysaccharide deacetylase family protein [Ferrimicrobium sp.]|uniref:polysaccharide deacetylase family protein n=1 Tax=Ferrimicrobium sp. TaxID=2926050 RepID=UPI00261B744B|nr:polysaccharide deacetylase family protein [Ferrimicrobium sp.]
MKTTTAIATLASAKIALHVGTFLAHTWLLAPLTAPWLLGNGHPQSIALTFDDGPDPISTPQVLDILERNAVKATFFVLGEMVDRQPQLIRDILAAGHELGVHGYWHKNHLFRSARSIRYDIARTLAAVEAAGGVRPTWYRPPYGVVTRADLTAAHAEGLRIVLWGTWGRDWRRQASAVSVMADLRSRLRPGSTILLHDSDHTSYPGSFQTTIQALPQLIDLARSQELAFVTLAHHGI